MTDDLGASRSQDAYDALPYASGVHRELHPMHLGVAPTLFGLRPAPPDVCRVLDLGCGTADDLVALAYALPGSTFVGIDGSRAHIEAAQARVDVLGLRNLDLRVADLRDPSLFGPADRFDYVLCSGVFSWVDAATRDAVLALCARHLTDEGVACIGYAVAPGASLLQIGRTIMRYGSRGTTAPSDRVAAARATLDAIAAAVEGDGGMDPQARLGRAYAETVQALAAGAATTDDANLLHDDLSDELHALMVSEFAALAARHGLAYLADAAQPLDPLAALSDPARATVLGRATDAVGLEQHVDFVTWRTARSTILCRAARLPERVLYVDAVRGLFATTPARPGGLDPASGVETWIGPSGWAVPLPDGPTRAAMRILAAAYPAGVGVEDVLVQATGSAHGPVAESLANELLGTFAQTRGLVELRTGQVPATATPGERPRASALARLESAAAATATVTSLAHVRVDLDGHTGELLRLCDGTRTWAELAAATTDGDEVVLGDRLAALASVGLLHE